MNAPRIKWRRTSAVLFVATVACTSFAPAGLIVSSWIGGDVVANWHDATKWSNGIPGHEFEAIINAVGANTAPQVEVTQDTSASKLSLGPRVTVGVRQVNWLGISESFAMNDNRFILSGWGSLATQLQFGTSVSLNSGTILFEDGRGQVTVNGTLTLGTGLTVGGNSGGIFNTGTLINYAQLRGATNHGSIELRGNRVQNHGTLACTNAQEQLFMNVPTFRPITNTGTVASDSGGLIRIRAGSLNNSGLLAATNGGTIDVDTLGGILNSGTIVLDGANLFLRSRLQNTGAGTIIINSGTLALGGTFNLFDTSALRMPRNSELVILGNLVTQNQTLSIKAASHGWILDGGEIGGRIQTQDGRALVARSGTLGLDSLNGTVEFNSPGRLHLSRAFSGAGTIITGTVGQGTVGSSTEPLTLGHGITIRGGGAIGDHAQPFDNFGHIISEGAVISGRLFRNFGVIDGDAAFYGLYRLSDLGQLNGSRYTLLAEALNDGHTFRVDGTTPEFLLGGTVYGGTISTGDGRVIRVPSPEEVPYDRLVLPRLHNVTVNGSLSIAGGASLEILNGTLQGTGDIHLDSTASSGPARLVAESGPLTISQGMTVHGGGGLPDEPLGHASGVGKPDKPGFNTIVNRGTLRAEQSAGEGSTGEFDLAGSSILNDGTIVIASDAFMYAFAGVSSSSAETAVAFRNGGVLDIEMSASPGSGLLLIDGSLDLRTPGDTLLLATASGVVPGAYYRIVTTSAGISGQFDTVASNFEVEYRNGTEIWARFVPEPTCAIFLAASIIGVGRRRR